MNSPRPANHRHANAADAATLASIEAAEVYERLVTSRNGFSTNEVPARLLRFGPNALPPLARTPWWIALRSNFVHLFALLLWAAAVLAWLAGMPELTVAIALVVVVNGAFSYWQQYVLGIVPGKP